MAAEDREGHVPRTGAGAEARGHYHRALDLRRCYIGDPMKSGPEEDDRCLRSGGGACASWR